jgi:HEAT repeat protein
VAKTGDAAVLEALTALAKDSVPEVRREAAAAHAKASGKPITPKVLGETALPLPGFDTELLSVDHCKREGKKLDAGAVAPLLFDGRPTVRANAASALGALGKAAAPHILHLCLALKDGDVRVRIATAVALAELGLEPETCVPALTAALRGAEGELEEALLAAIASFGKKVVELVLSLLGGRPELVTGSVGKVARHLPDLFVKPLSDVLGGDGSIIARENAADVLAGLGDVAGKAEGALLDALSYDAVLLRVKVIGAVGRVAKPSKKVAEMLTALEEADQRLSIQDAVHEARMYLRARG